MFEYPIVFVAAEAVDEQDRISGFAPPEIADVPAVNRHNFRSYRRLIFFRCAGNTATLKIIYKRLDFGLRNLAFRDDAKQRSHWHAIAFLYYLALQQSAVGRLDDAGDLIAFYLDHFGSGLNR